MRIYVQVQDTVVVKWSGMDALLFSAAQKQEQCEVFLANSSFAK